MTKIRNFLMFILSFSSVNFFSAAPSHASVITTINVTDLCQISGDVTSCINTALSSMVSTGGTLYFPCGNYTISGTITVSAGNIKLIGSGRCTVWNAAGSGNTIEIFGSISSPYYGNSIENIRFAEFNKTGGYTIYAANVAQFLLNQLYIDRPWCGPRIHNFNDVLVERVSVYNAIGASRGYGCQAFLLTGGGAGDTGRSDVITFRDFVVAGNSIADRTNAHHGLVVDGFVNTVSAQKMYLTAVDGHGLWIRNTIGASHGPEFGSFYGIEADYNYDSAIFIESGDVYHFTDSLINGTLSNSNIFLNVGVNRISFQGGFSSNANRAGFDSFATQLTIANVDVVCNSNPGQGGTAGTWSGIALESTSRTITLTGNKSGCPGAPSLQKFGIEVNNGADQYAITGNALGNNALGA